MARGKAINVKVARTKVIKALEETLDKLEKTWAKQEKIDEAYEKAKDEYNAKVAEIAIKHFSKAENIRINQRWTGDINVDFNLPAGLAKLPTEPKSPEREIWNNDYQIQKREMENAIRILKLSDEEVVSTSTYQAVAQYL